MTPVTSTLEQAIILLADVACLDFASLDEDSALAVATLAEQAGRYLDTVRALSAADLDDRSRYELGSDGLGHRLGHRKGLHLVESITRCSQAEAARRIRLGGAIRPRRTLDGRVLEPRCVRVAEAMVSGTMGADAAAVIIRGLDQAAPHAADLDLLADAEESLVRAATTETADGIATWTRVWREALDPDGAPQREEDLRARRRFSLGRESHGLTTFSGACDPLSAALLRVAFSEHGAPDAAPRFLAEADCVSDGPVAHRPVADGSHGNDSPEADPDARAETIRDPRTREQRQLDILFGLLTAGLRSTGLEPGGMRSTTTVMVVVLKKDLESGRGVGWLDDVAEPISAATVQSLACDSGIQEILLGDHGEVLALGRLRRTFSPAQRRALAVRDGGCIWDGCTAPPAWCDAHHVKEWEADHGATDLQNGVLLCPEHHRALHASEFSLVMVDGRPRLLAPPWVDPSQTWRPLGRQRVTMAARVSPVPWG